MNEAEYEYDLQSSCCAEETTTGTDSLQATRRRWWGFLRQVHKFAMSTTTDPSFDNTNSVGDDGAEPPIIDLSRPESEVTAQIAQACSTWGFFQVISHGVSLDLVDEFKSESQNSSTCQGTKNWH